jgi:hypothetical protein
VGLPIKSFQRRKVWKLDMTLLGLVPFSMVTGGGNKLVEVKSRMKTLFDKIPLYEQVTSLTPTID